MNRHLRVRFSAFWVRIVLRRKAPSAWPMPRSLARSAFPDSPFSLPPQWWECFLRLAFKARVYRTPASLTSSWTHLPLAIASRKEGVSQKAREGREKQGGDESTVRVAALREPRDAAPRSGTITCDHSTRGCGANSTRGSKPGRARARASRKPCPEKWIHENGSNGIRAVQ